MDYKTFIKKQYSDDDLSQDELLNDLKKVLIQENVVEEDILDEVNTSTIVNGLSVGLILKMRNQRQKITSQTDTNKKLDEMSVLVMLSGYGGLLGGFVSQKNTKILNKI